MPSRRSESKRTVTFRLPTDLVTEMREFVRDNAGKPLYLTPAIFVEAAITNHLNHLRQSGGEAATEPRGRNNSPNRSSH